MAITINIYYCGVNGNARKFADGMVSSGVLNDIRAEEGNIRYEYFSPMDDKETVFLIDSWKDQHFLNAHHTSPMMAEIILTNVKIFQFPHSTCHIIGQHALCGKENLSVNEYIKLREKYNLHMKVERYVSDGAGVPATDKRFIKE